MGGGVAPRCLGLPSIRLLPASVSPVQRKGLIFSPPPPPGYWHIQALLGHTGRGGGGADLSVGHVCPWGQSLSSPPGVIAWWQLLDTWVHSMEDGEGGDNNMVPGHLRPWLGWGGG